MRFISKTIIVNFMISIVIFDLECVSLVGSDKPRNNNHDIKRQKSDTNDSEVVTEGKRTVIPLRRNGLNWKEIRKQIQGSLNHVTRCSRRFYPGVCSEPVSSVWTYSFRHQNCTERFGCRISTQANRFRSYYMCVHNCKTLIDITTYIFAHQEGIKSDEYSDSDDHSPDNYESIEEEEKDNGILKKVKNARRKAIKTLKNLISSVKEDNGYSDEFSLGFPDSHDVELPEDLQRSLLADLDQMDYENMDVNYDFNTGKDRRP